MARRLSIIAVSAVLSLAVVTTAHAQNNKPVRSGTFYEDRAINSSGSQGAILTFAQAPVDKFLNITDVTCYVFSSPGGLLTYATLYLGTQSAANDIGRDFDVAGNATITDSSSGAYSNITNKTFIKVGPGRFPTIGLGVKTGATTTFGKCTIVGTLTDD